MTPREIFEQKLSQSVTKEKADSVGGTFQFNIGGDNGGSWFIDLTKESEFVQEGTLDGALCVIAIADGDFVGIIDGSLNAQMAFMGGKLKVTGPDPGKAMSLALKLQTLLA
jgi:putative sterol carrier protein